VSLLLKMGTRGSALAIAQARMVSADIERKYPESKVQEIIIQTSGDKMKEIPFLDVGVKGVFIKEIEEALLQGDIDFAVHSLKDLPTELTDGMAIAAYGRKVETNDCLISAKSADIKNLPLGARVGTSSLRRQAQLLSVRPDLKVEAIRGNLDTRLRKLKAGEFDAIVVAMAGIQRLYGGKVSSEFKLYKIPFSEMLPCVGQGILAIEILSERKDLVEKLKFLNEENSEIAARAERTFLKILGGTCRLPMAATAQVEAGVLSMEGMIASPKGGQSMREKVVGSIKNPEEIGRELAEKFINSKIGKKVLEEIRN